MMSYTRARAEMEGAGLVFTKVALSTSGASTTLLLAAEALKYQRLHGLIITVSAAALVEIEDIGGGTDTWASWNLGSNGGLVMHFNRDPKSAIQSDTIGEGLQIVNSAGNLCGYAIVSTGE